MTIRYKMIRTVLMFLCFLFLFPVQSKAEVIKHGVWNDFVYSLGEGLRIENYRGNAKTLRIPERIKGKPVVAVVSLSKAKNLEKLIVPNGVYAKWNNAIRFDYAPATCKTLKKIVISSSNPWYRVKNGLLVSRDGKELYGCPGAIKNPKIPDSVVVIHESAFRNSDMEKIALGKNVEEISHEVFYGCKKLKKIQWNKKVEWIGDGVFDKCSLITELVLPDSVKFINTYAFTGCKSLKKLTVGKNVKKIPRTAIPDKTIVCGKKGCTVKKGSRYWRVTYKAGKK